MSTVLDPIPCPHLYLVGDERCRLCLSDVRGMILTDQNDDGIDWGELAPSPESVATWTPDDGQQSGAVAPNALRPVVSYPEHGPLPEAPISINFKVTGEPQITIRGFNASEITAIFNDLEDGGVWANIAAAQASLRSQGQLGAALGPMTPVPPAQAPQQTPGGFMAPPSAPSMPAYGGQPSSQFAPPPQNGGWAGNGGGGQQGGRAQPKPQPPGWFRVNARTGPGFDAWKNWREQYKDQLKGKIQWGDKSDYWIEPSLAQHVSQMGFAVTP